MKTIVLGLCFLLILQACAPRRPPPAPDGFLPWGAVDLNADPPEVVLTEGRRTTGPAARNLLAQLPRTGPNQYAYPVLTVSGGGSHGAWGAGFLKGWSERGDRPQFRVVTSMSVGALIATPAFLGTDYDYILEEFFTRRSDSDLYTLGPGSVLGGLFGKGHFAGTDRSVALMEALITDEVIDAVADAYRSGRRLYVSTGNFDEDAFTLWDLGAIASSDEPTRYDYYRKVLRAAIAVPGAFPPEYFRVEGIDEIHGQMHLDAGTNFVYVDGFMAGEDAAANREALAGNEVEVPVYVIMNTQRQKDFEGPPSGAPLDLVLRSYQRIGRFASYAALDRLWIAVSGSDDVYLQIARIPDDLKIPFDVFEFPQPGMADLFDVGRQAAAGYRFEDRPVDTPVPRRR